MISCWQLLVGTDVRQASTAALLTLLTPKTDRKAQITMHATFPSIQTVAKDLCEANKVCLGPNQQSIGFTFL